MTPTFTSGAPLESIKAARGIETLSQEVMPWRSPWTIRRFERKARSPNKTGVGILDHQKFQVPNFRGTRWIPEIWRNRGVGLSFKPYSCSL